MMLANKKRPHEDDDDSSSQSSNSSDSSSDSTESSVSFETAHLDNTVVKIFLTHFKPNYKHPWKSSTPKDLVGSGAVINQERGLILTTAHVAIPDAIFWVRLGNDLKKYPAKMLISEADCDLGLLQVEDPIFRQKCKQLKFGEFQGIGSPVAALGFPVIHDELTTTYGTIIANEVIDYPYGDSFHLASTTDASINTGQTGGPIVDPQGKLVGIVFQAIAPDEAEKAAFLAPMPVVRQFLRAAFATIDNHLPYRGLPSMPFDTEKMLNTHYRSAYKMLPNVHSGIRVKSIDPLAILGGLQVDDVILSIDGHQIHNDETISSLPHINQRLDFNYLIYQKQMGETVAMHILRDGVEHHITVPLQYRAHELKLLGRKNHTNKNTFYIKNGLCFQPLTASMYFNIKDKQLPNNIQDASDTDIPNFFDSIHDYPIEIPQCIPHEQWVIIHYVFKSPLTEGYLKSDRIVPVDTVNGNKIRHMHDLIFAMESNRGNTHFITLKNNEKLTLRVARPEDEQEIALHYQIYKTHSDDLNTFMQALKRAPQHSARSTTASMYFTRSKAVMQDLLAHHLNSSSSNKMD